MSLVQNNPLKVTLIDDPRVTFDEWSIPARFGGSGILYSRQSANSLAGSAGTTSFTVKPNNPGGSVIAPNMIVYTKCTFAVNNTINPAPTNPLFNQGVTDAPRAYPILSCCDSMSLTLNGAQLMFPNMNMIGHALRRFNPRAAMYKSANFCPWYPDSGVATYENLVATGRNPLGAAGVGDFDFSRGAYQRVVYTNTAGDTNKGTVVLETWEPINLSPLLYDMKAQGLPYINTLDLTLNVSNLHRALSHAVPTGGANPQGAIPNGAVVGTVVESTLFYQQINLPLFAREIAPVVCLPAYKLAVNQSPQVVPSFGVPAVGAVTPAGTQFQSEIINYPCIPSRIYAFAQPALPNLTMGHPDFTYMYTGGLQVTWGTNNYMVNVSLQQLYTSAVDAGYAFPYENFGGSYLLSNAAGAVGSSGAVICLRPGIDFPLDAGQAVGQAVACSCQIIANFHEQRAASSGGGAMWQVAVLPSVLTLSSNFTAQLSTGVITSEDVLAAGEKLDGTVTSADVHDAFGSGIFDEIKSALPMLKRIGRLAHSGLSSIKDAGLLGEGVVSGGSSMSGGAASMYGGARLSKSDLSRRMR